MDEGRFEKLAGEELAALEARLRDQDGLEADLANGILTLELDDGGPNIVVNSHAAARQIWVAANLAAAPFGYDQENSPWVRTPPGGNVRPTWYGDVSRDRTGGGSDEAARDEIPELGREAEARGEEAQGSSVGRAASSEKAPEANGGARDHASARRSSELAESPHLPGHRQRAAQGQGALRAAGDPLHRAGEPPSHARRSGGQRFPGAGNERSVGADCAGTEPRDWRAGTCLSRAVPLTRAEEPARNCVRD